MNKPWPIPQQTANVMAPHSRQSIVFLATAHDNGGTSILSSNLAAAMRKEGHHVEEWYLFDSPADLPAGARLFVKHTRSRSPFTLLALFVRVILALRQHKPDALFGLQPLSNVLVGVAGRIAGIRNRIATLHGPFGEDNRVLVRINRFIGRRGFYRHIIACARSTADTFVGNGPDYLRRMIVIPNGHTRPVLISRAEARRQLGLPAEGIVLGQLGRLSFQKNQSFSIGLLKSLPGTSLLLIGIGPDETALRSEISAAGLSNRIHILPSIEHARIGHFYSAVDLVLFPSRFEGLSLAAIEAIHAGVPLICSDIPSFRELFCASTPLTEKLIVPLADRDGWLAGIRAVLSDKTLRQHVVAELARLSPMFAFDRMARQYLAVLD
jgi:glycosyltransferase involved in cell wall biosynthesis